MEAVGRGRGRAHAPRGRRRRRAGSGAVRAPCCGSAAPSPPPSPRPSSAAPSSSSSSQVPGGSGGQRGGARLGSARRCPARPGPARCAVSGPGAAPPPRLREGTAAPRGAPPEPSRSPHRARPALRRLRGCPRGTEPSDPWRCSVAPQCPGLPGARWVAEQRASRLAPGVSAELRLRAERAPSLRCGWPGCACRALV